MSVGLLRTSSISETNDTHTRALLLYWPTARVWFYAENPWHSWPLLMAFSGVGCMDGILTPFGYHLPYN
jgi:hypothetical protein